MNYRGFKRKINFVNLKTGIFTMAEVDLPEEVLLHILSFIPHQEMDNVMLVNKTFYAYCSKQKSFKQRLCINKDKVIN